MNGKVNPYHAVNRAAYRLRLLNACSNRYLVLTLAGDAGCPALPMVQVATDSALLPAPLSIDSLTMGPGERAEVVVDFSSATPGCQYELKNSAPTPFPGQPGAGVIPRVMQVRLCACMRSPEAFAPPSADTRTQFVVGSTVGPGAALASSLGAAPPVFTLTGSTVQRTFELTQPASGALSACDAGSMWSLNNQRFYNLTDIMVAGGVEAWRFVNPTTAAHPMHSHAATFLLRSRAYFHIDNATGAIVEDGKARWAVASGSLMGPLAHTGPAPTYAFEQGWKDTVPLHDHRARVGQNEVLVQINAPPGQVTHVWTQMADYPGRFVVHCHMLDHEVRPSLVSRAAGPPHHTHTPTRLGALRTTR